MSTIAELLRAQYELRPGALALLAPGRVPSSYADLHALALRVTGALRGAGFDHRSRIALCVPNGPEAAAGAIAVAAGATCVPLNPDYQEAEFRFCLESMHADAVFVCRRQRGSIRCIARELGIGVFELGVDANGPAGIFELQCTQPGTRTPPCVPASDVGERWSAAADVGERRTKAVDVGGWPAAHDVALLLHTPGATAHREVVSLSQAKLVAWARNVAAHFALKPTDRGLNVMPLVHVHGLVGSLLATLAAGASLVCTAGFEEDTFFEHVADFDPSWYSAAPSIHRAILAHGAAYRARAPLHAFRFAGSAPAALSPTMLAQLESLLGAPVIEGLPEHADFAQREGATGSRRITPVPHRGKSFIGARPGRCDHADSPLPQQSTAR